MKKLDVKTSLELTEDQLYSSTSICENNFNDYQSSIPGTGSIKMNQTATLNFGGRFRNTGYKKTLKPSEKRSIVT